MHMHAYYLLLGNSEIFPLLVSKQIIQCSLIFIYYSRWYSTFHFYMSLKNFTDAVKTIKRAIIS